MITFKMGDEELTTEKLVKLSCSSDLMNLKVSSDALERVVRFRNIIDGAVAKNTVHYGINTGFGFLSNVQIPSENLKKLQLNIIRSHACGVGEYLNDDMVRGLLLLRLHTFLLGNSGISLETVNTILSFLKEDILPRIPCQGSVGASGDLAPLSHLALGLIGEGEVVCRGVIGNAKDVCKRRAIRTLDLKPKEGLSLINGTHFMSVLSAFAVEQAKCLLQSVDIISALSLEAIRGTVSPFDERIHLVRKHRGQNKVAANFREIFRERGSIMESHRDCDKVQDPYSFRCIPQVHGASRDVLDYVEEKINIELNSVTDNPLCFEDGSILSGGNFHGQPIAIAMDVLAIAMSEIGSISERRIEKLTNPAMSGLPPFITRDSGMNSGFMIPHVVAAALASENKVLCHPASVDSIPTSADKEDHVSMGPIAARKALKIIEHVSIIMSIELLAAAQGVELLTPLEPNSLLKTVYNRVRELSPIMIEDRSLHKDIEAIRSWIMQGGILQVAAKYGLDLE